MREQMVALLSAPPNAGNVLFSTRVDGVMKALKPQGLFCQQRPSALSTSFQRLFTVSTTINVRTPLPLYVGEGEKGVLSKVAERHPRPKSLLPPLEIHSNHPKTPPTPPQGGTGGLEESITIEESK